MDLKFGDVQETALIPLAIKASETVRPNARIKDYKAKEIIDTLEEYRYIFMFGEAGSYKELTIEKCAHNISNGVDNVKEVRENSPILIDGAAELYTNIDFSSFNEDIRFSEDAGKYLCNYSYYLVLNRFKNTKALFIHVPYIDEINTLESLSKKAKSIIEYVISKDIKIKTYDSKQKDAIDIRIEVFVDEQGFVDEFDAIDDISTHFVCYVNSHPLATARLFYEKKIDSYHIGRLAVRKAYRNLGIGTLMLNGIEQYLNSINAHQVVLGSQVQAKEFYMKCGYEPYGDIFLDEDSPHIMMKKVF